MCGSNISRKRGNPRLYLILTRRLGISYFLSDRALLQFERKSQVFGLEAAKFGDLL